MEGRSNVSRSDTSALGFTEGILTVQDEKEEKTALGLSNPSNSVGPCGDARIGLELGKRTYFEVPGSASSSNAQSLTKKVRSSQVPKCQVEGCTADLSSAKDYHRRHKVCPAHSKTPRVIVAGREQRFCQQCSRFHSLTEFDEGKRSCRRRLAGHNERRRKPQPDPLSLHARYLPAFQESLRLRHLYVDRPYLPVRIPGVSNIWEEYNALKANEQKSTWPSRMLKHEDQSTFTLSSRTGMEQQLLLSGFQQQNDKSSFFLPQSPNCTFSVKSDVSGSKTHHYFQESVSPIGQSLTLSGSSGAGVLSGLEAVPVGQGFTRVSDSGRALSLQSTMELGFSTQASVAESLDSTLSVVSENALDQNNIPIAEPIVQQRGEILHFGWKNDKIYTAANLHSLSSTKGCSSGSSSIVNKNNSCEGSYFHVLNGVGNYESNPLYLMSHGDVQAGNVAQDVKPTMDLMQVTSSTDRHNSQAVISTGSFDMENNHYEDLQTLRSYGFSIFNSQHM